MSRKTERVPVRIEAGLAAAIESARDELRARGVSHEEGARILRERFGGSLTLERIGLSEPVTRKDVVVNAHGVLAGSRHGGS